MRDFKWLVIFVILLSVIITASIMNTNHEPDTTARIENSINVDNGDLKIDWTHYPTTNIKLDKSFEITSSGTYHLTGTMQDGEISIKTSQDGVVRLILDNATIENTDGPAIACYSGDDLVIELVGDNAVIDGSNYLDSYDEDVKGSIYSKADLSFAGDGSLNLTGNHEDGIVSKDDLTFRSGTYKITTQDDGIRGKDSVHVADGNFTINATADAIKSTNETDQGKGFILIEDGNFNLDAGAKGIKSTNSILLHDGHFVINTTDDSIHSDNYIAIIGGEFSISAGDDAIHANRELEIGGGKIKIAKSYEGLEAQKITINDGDISITANDDGVNTGGGADNSATNRANGSPFDADEDCILSINGGNIYINASGDGIDSNGWLYINDGEIVVDGPTDNGNGALDAGMGIIVNGGEMIAIGASGMAETPNQTSGINSFSIFLNQVYPTKTTIEIKDKEDNTIIKHIAAKSFSHIVATSPSFQLGETYTLYLDDELYANMTVSGTVTTFGNNRTSIQKR